MFHGAAEEFVRIGHHSISSHGKFVIALSGGSTPRSLYSLLATNYMDFDWNHTFFFFGDERHVPPDHAESNYRMAKESLLSKVPIPTQNIFRVQAENPDANAAAADYEVQLGKFFKLQQKNLPTFDLVLLGLGADGHTASLFPDSPGLTEETRLVIANRVEKFNTDRITLTFPVLNHATDAMFLVSGGDKAKMIHEILEGHRQPPYPAQLVQPQGRLLWMLDEAAGSQL